MPNMAYYLDNTITIKMSDMFLAIGYSCALQKVTLPPLNYIKKTKPEVSFFSIFGRYYFPNLISGPKITDNKFSSDYFRPSAIICAISRTGASRDRQSRIDPIQA